MEKKALALLSGGLDSTLAVKLILSQGIEVFGLNFISPFCRCNRRSGCRLESKKVADRFAIPLKVIGVGKEYLDVVRNPAYGYGKNMNPCLDCRILMLRKARDYMEQVGASFIITGEVLGQRPMSQYKKAMKLIEREAGLEGLVLRPLSAKLLEPSLPEKAGIVDRKKLLGIKGRSRRPQIQLATELGISDYPCPAGGCLLTDPGFSRRIRDLFRYSQDPTLNDVELLKIGRHFRLSPYEKVVVGRNEDENKRLKGLLRPTDYCLRVNGYKGPLVLLRTLNEVVVDEAIHLAAKITVRYSDAPPLTHIEVSYRKGTADGKEGASVSTMAIDDKELDGLRI
jgi:tRNA U34 2-thiouridine synthase MnmA/TrmU